MGSKTSLMLQDEEIRQVSEETGFSAVQIEKLYSRFTHLDRAQCGSLGKSDLLAIPELAINPLCERLIEMFFAGGTGHGGDGGGGRASSEGGREWQEDERINFRQFMRVLAAFRTAGQSPLQGPSVGGASRPQATSRSSSAAAGPLSTLGSRRPKTAVRQSAPQLEDGSRSPHPTSVDNNNNNNNNNNTRRWPEVAPDDPDLQLAECLRDKLLFLFRIYDADADGRISFNDLRSILKLMVGNYIEEVQLDKIATRAFVEVDRDNDGFVEFAEFCRVFAGKDMEDKLRVRFF